MIIKKDDFFKIPNILSYLRILLVPVYIFVFYHADNAIDYFLSIFVVILSALTDLLDGFIARKFDWITDLGKIIDPIADKLMQTALLFTVIWKVKGILPLLILFVMKELISLFVGAVLYKMGKHLNGAIWCGKICTVVLYAVMLVFIILPNLDKNFVYLLVGIASLFLILSFVVYMLEYKKLYRQLI